MCIKHPTCFYFVFPIFTIIVSSPCHPRPLSFPSLQYIRLPSSFFHYCACSVTLILQVLPSILTLSLSLHRYGFCLPPFNWGLPSRILPLYNSLSFFLFLPTVHEARLQRSASQSGRGVATSRERVCAGWPTWWRLWENSHVAD